jgi:hypothetical protein
VAGDDGRTAEEFRDIGAIEGRRHHEEAQVRAQYASRLEREREAQVRIEGSLVKLVEDHQSHALERRVGLERAHQDALGHHLEPRARAHLGVEPGAVAHRLADALTHHRGHATRRRAGGKPPRLEHDNAPALEPWRIQQHERHQGGLARTRRRFQHGRTGCGERGGDARHRLRHRQPRLPRGQIHGRDPNRSASPCNLGSVLVRFHRDR